MKGSVQDPLRARARWLATETPNPYTSASLDTRKVLQQQKVSCGGGSPGPARSRRCTLTLPQPGEGDRHLCNMVLQDAPPLGVKWDCGAWRSGVEASAPGLHGSSQLQRGGIVSAIPDGSVLHVLQLCRLASVPPYLLEGDGATVEMRSPLHRCNADGDLMASLRQSKQCLVLQLRRLDPLSSGTPAPRSARTSLSRSLLATQALSQYAQPYFLLYASEGTVDGQATLQVSNRTLGGGATDGAAT